ncbi:hypothetical protein EDC96DRAFT_532294 [Choanephora cucurbitarum]|nr:hypothetical protein EDC96DRAFT_532294 [Choanephora cucurbitarum]
MHSFSLISIASVICLIGLNTVSGSPINSVAAKFDNGGVTNYLLPGQSKRSLMATSLRRKAKRQFEYNEIDEALSDGNKGAVAGTHAGNDVGGYIGEKIGETFGGTAAQLQNKGLGHGVTEIAGTDVSSVMGIVGGGVGGFAAGGTEGYNVGGEPGIEKGNALEAAGGSAAGGGITGATNGGINAVDAASESKKNPQDEERNAIFARDYVDFEDLESIVEVAPPYFSRLGRLSAPGSTGQVTTGDNVDLKGTASASGSVGGSGSGSSITNGHNIPLTFSA